MQQRESSGTVHVAICMPRQMDVLMPARVAHHCFFPQQHPVIMQEQCALGPMPLPEDGQQLPCSSCQAGSLSQAENSKTKQNSAFDQTTSNIVAEASDATRALRQPNASRSDPQASFRCPVWLASS
jgi:hypothetical protein